MRAIDPAVAIATWLVKIPLRGLPILLLWPSAARGQSGADGFDPGTNGSVLAFAVQADGRILVGGRFTQLGGQDRDRIARLNANGTLQAGFNPGANNEIRVLAVQSDGRILVAGNFTQLGGQTRNHIGRVNSNGILDTTFNPGADGAIRALVLQADGKIVVGGDFAQLAGQPRNRIGRLNTDGTLDTTFNPGATGGQVFALAIQAGGRILVGGNFTQLGGQPRDNVGRLNADGTLDPSFNPETDNFIATFAFQADGKIVVGGAFTLWDGQQRGRLARLHADGTLDTSFNAGVTGLGIPTVESIVVQADGKIVVGGNFSELGGQPRENIGRLNQSGTLDPGFNPGAVGFLVHVVFTVALQADGKILVGGAFTGLGGQPRNNLGRVHPDGTPDANLDPTPNSNIAALAVQADGKILVGASFTQIAGQNRTRIARLKPDGTLDTDFQSGASHTVRALAVQPDGKIVVGGDFTQLGPLPRNFIGRLNPGSTLDVPFNPGASGGVVITLLLQPDGKIVVGGEFTHLAGQPRNNIGRLHADGTLDASFIPVAAMPGMSSRVSALAAQSDGKIVVGGVFTQFGGQFRKNLGRVNADGTLDPTFDPVAERPGMSSGVNAIAVQVDGMILVGGNFTQLGGQARESLGRLNPDGTLDTSFNAGVTGLGIPRVEALVVQTDGKIVVGGYFQQLAGQPRENVGRLNQSGTLDLGFNPGAAGFLVSVVTTLALQADGKILVGGDFTLLGGEERNNLGRVTNTDAALQNLSVDSAGTTVTWLRSGASPEVDRVTMELSSDALNYTFLGHGTRITGGWQLSGFALPTNQNIFVRTRGFYGTDGGGGTSVAESVRAAFIPAISIRIKTIAKTGNTVTITLDSFTGYVFRLQRSLSSLDPAAFIDTGSTQSGSTGNVLTFTDPNATSDITFYRVTAGP